MLRIFLGLLFFYWYYPICADSFGLEARSGSCFEGACEEASSLYSDFVPMLSELTSKAYGKKCGTINPQKLNSGFKKIFKIYNKNKLNPSLSTFKVQNKNSHRDQENMLFNALARSHAVELKCASKYAETVLKTENSAFKKVVFSRLEILKKAKKRLTFASSKLAKDVKLMNKFCPIDLQQLEKNRSYNRLSNYKICKEIITSRAVYDTVLKSVPFINTPSMKKFISQEVIRNNNDLRDYRFERSMASVSRELDASALLLDESINNKHSLANRKLRYYLLGNPIINESLAKDSQKPASFKSLLCHADSRYKEGTKKLENTLLIGSFALGGLVGLGARGLGMINVVSKVGAVGRTSTFSKVLQTSSLGVTGASAYAQISRKCFKVEKPELEVSKFSSGGKCTENSLNIKKIENDSCFLAAVLSLIGFKAGTTNKFFKSSSKKALEVNKTIHDQIQNKLRDSFKTLINPAKSLEFIINTPVKVVSRVKVGLKKGDTSQIWRVPIKIIKEDSGTISAMALISYINGKTSIEQLDYDNKETKSFRDNLGKEIYVLANLVSESDSMFEIPESDFKNDFGKQPRTHYIQATSYQELKRKLTQLREKEGLIYGMKIYGHGSPGSMSTGDDRLTSFDLDRSKPLENVFKPGSKILLNNCSTGGGKKGMLFTKKLGTRCCLQKS